MKILIIIPCYNEELNILDVVKKVKEQEQEVDYLVINDCSKDNTKEILINNNIPFLDLRINLGIGGCVQTGYKYAYENKYDIAIQIDGDGQHDPQYIKNLIQPIKNGEANMVIASRFINKEGFQSSFIRRLGINWLSFIIKILVKEKVYDVTSGYRAIDKNLIKLFKDDLAQDYPEPEAIINVYKMGYKIKEIPTKMLERQGGESSINSFKSIYYMIKVTIALLLCKIKDSTKP